MSETVYDKIIAAINAEIEKQKKLGINPSIRTFISGEMAAIEIIEEMKKNDE